MGHRRRPGSRSALPDWIRHRTLPASTAREIRHAVLSDFHEVSGAGVSVHHGVALVEGAMHFSAVQVLGPDEWLARGPDIDGRPIAELMEIRPGTLSEFNRFGLAPVAHIRDNLMYRAWWQPMGFVECVSMSAVVADTFVGWIGGWRGEEQGPFDATVSLELRPRVDAYVHALDVAYRLDGHARADRGLVLFEPSGDVAYACDSGRAWLADDHFARETGERVAARSAGGEDMTFWAGGAVVRLTEMRGESGVLYCADIAPTEPWGAVALGFLSVKKRRIAEAAALGATVQEIARSMEVKPETVRVHLKAIYESLGVSCRVELAEKVREVTEKAVLPS